MYPKRVTFDCPPPPLESRPHSSSDTITQHPSKEQILMAPTFDMNRKANQAALLRSPLLSRTDINAKHNHYASSTSTATSSSSPEEPRTPPDQAAGVIDHGKELDDAMQTKGVNFSAISSSFPDASVTRVHPKSLLARITRTNPTVGQRVANELLEGVMSTSTHASSNVS
ncbi:hypothetical protein CPB85DRAFT_1257509 [Mucidula mucida]|nr:hypothetical protein CPB85DRAFT_1257509 [Mucidula mucida]